MFDGEIVKELRKRVEQGLQDGEVAALANAYEPARLLFMTDTCIDILKRLHDLLPEDDKYTLALADAWAHMGKFDRADEFYSAESDSNSPSFQLSMGDSLRLRGQYDEAAKMYLKANEMFRGRFDHVIFMSTEFRNPAEDKLNDIYHLLSDELKKKVMGSINIKVTSHTTELWTHFTPPMMINSTVIKDILMEKYPTIVPVTLKVEGENPEEIQTYIDTYLSYIDSNPMDTYAEETAGRMLYIIGSKEKAIEMFTHAYSIYEEKGTMLGELQIQSRHYLQLCMRFGKKPKKSVLDTVSLWDPEDPLISASNTSE